MSTEHANENTDFSTVSTEEKGQDTGQCHLV